MLHNSALERDWQGGENEQEGFPADGPAAEEVGLLLGVGVGQGAPRLEGGPGTFCKQKQLTLEAPDAKGTRTAGGRALASHPGLAGRVVRCRVRDAFPAPCVRQHGLLLTLRALLIL